MVTIKVDDREPAAMLELLTRVPNVKVVSERLAVGDYQLENWVLFERKTVADLEGSLLDGRLFSQAFRLAKSMFLAVLVLEGRTDQLRVSRPAFRGALISINIHFGIPIIRSAAIEDSVSVLAVAARQFCKKQYFVRPARSPKEIRRIQHWVLQSFPGVGPETARNILNAFGSLNEFFCAKPYDWRKIPLLGKTRSRIIREILNYRQPQSK